MNKVYLMIDEKKDFALIKVGFASDMETRARAYSTHNVLVECRDTIDTMEKSQKNVESLFHKEILKRGYSFVVSPMTWVKTEWFKISYDDPFYTELKEKGLRAFECGKKRKSYGKFYTKKAAHNIVLNWWRGATQEEREKIFLDLGINLSKL